LPQLRLERAVLVEATLEEVWKAWTTVAGVKRFFAPDGRIQLALGGKYELYFDLDAPVGRRGSEGSRVLSYLPQRMLSFSWGAPPQFEKSRRELAQWVVLFFDRVDDHRTMVRLEELGWKDTEEGRKVYQYFDQAWALVLARLAYSFAKHPIDWGHPYRP
jgi:uncharacterized protein YndB with AHSA1/START domain